MFPPKKQGPPSKGKPQRGPGGPPPEGPGRDTGIGGPPDPFGGGMGGPPMGMDPFGGMGGPPPVPGLQPGAPRPGMPIDPMQAMQFGMGPDPMAAGPMGPPMGPDGLPVGGQLPPMGDGDADDQMGGSPLLQALQSSLSGGGDPYAVAPGQPDQGFQGMGTGDPGMGLEQLLQMLALGQMGVGGGMPGVGSSGIDPSQGNVGFGL